MTEFELILLWIVGFVLGAIIGWRVNDYLHRTVLAQLLEEAGVTQEKLNEMMVKLRQELPDDHPDKLREGDDALPVVEVKIEQHGDMLYAFRKEDDQFLGQGRDREELIKRLQDGNKHTFKMLVSQEDGADLLQKNNT